MKILQKLFGCKRGPAVLKINQGRMPTENNAYWYVPVIAEGEPIDLLFTDAEMINAQNRAKRNPEDCRL